MIPKFPHIKYVKLLAWSGKYIKNYLESIGSGAGQHLVDAENVERMDTDSNVELILGRVLHHVLK